ncbi:MAG TPA: (2Fe-2S) ferredoxin domain-containing protein [Thermomicrobiales bacterium]|nr:(2Fe-2S) ferredoxin domain-containing protein [Thermomicrobiales bacterium]
MYWNRKHVLVCTASHCMQKGANNVAGRLRLEMKRKGLDTDVLVNTCDSIDLCDIGPNIIVYPEQVIYSHVQVSDLKDIMVHLQGGEPVERLTLTPDTPEEAEREGFYRAATASGDTVTAEEFGELVTGHGYDDAWVNEQARRGFIARKEADGVPSITVTTKALQRYRITIPTDDRA